MNINKLTPGNIGGLFPLPGTFCLHSSQTAIMIESLAGKDELNEDGLRTKLVYGVLIYSASIWASLVCPDTKHRETNSMRLHDICFT